MISIRMVSHNIPDNGESVLIETFENYRQAFNFLTGYIGAAPIRIKELETEEW